MAKQKRGRAGANTAAQIETRRYRSPLREDQARLTQRRILMATAEMLKEKEAVELTIADVAAAAGVSSRTVYRHYPAVPDLLHGVARMLMEEELASGDPSSLDSVFRHLERQNEKLDQDWRWALVTTKVPGLEVVGGKEIFLRMLESRSGHLDEHGRRLLAALISHICSPNSIVVTSGLWGLKASSAIALLRPVVDKVIELSVERPDLFRAAEPET
jgi:AcrR family transcriptional regulator